MNIACKTIINIPMTWKTKLLLIWAFLAAAKPRLGSRFVKRELVSQQAPLTTTHKTMSSRCYFTYIWITLYGKSSLFVELDSLFLLLHTKAFFFSFSTLICGKTLQSSHYCILHSKNPVCLQTSTGLLAQKGKNAIPSDYLNK